MTTYVVIEHFYPNCKDAIYERFHEKGRMLPEGLEYIDSWLTKEGDKCFQLMRTDNFSLFEKWIRNWSDLGEFEIIAIGDKPVDPNT